MVLYKKGTQNKQDYSYQFSINECEIYLDHQNQVIKVVWEGRVDQETASSLLTYAADLVEGGLIDKVLLDRRNLIQFQEAARNWIKNKFILKRCSQIIHKIAKVAIVNENSIAARFYGESISYDIEEAFPQLEINKFDNRYYNSKSVKSVLFSLILAGENSLDFFIFYPDQYTARTAARKILVVLRSE